MSDFFHPGADAWRDEAWTIIKECEHLDWLILTKRPEMMLGRMPADWAEGYPNVWLGVTVENDRHLDRLPLLVDVPAAIHFISAEPLLGPIDFRPYLAGIDWLITGCERAAKDKRRAMELAWVRDLRSQCLETDTSFFFKQYYDGTTLRYDGLLDGKVCQAWPVPANGCCTSGTGAMAIGR